MKKMKKMASVVLVLAVCAGLFAGCGRKFDAKTYLQEYLNAGYKGECKEFCKLTEQTEEEAKKVYEDNAVKIRDDMLSVGSVNISEETQAKYLELVKKMLNLAKFEVVSAEQDKDKNFVAKVEIEPLLMFDSLEDDMTKVSEEYLTKLAEDMLAGGEQPSEEEIYEEIMKKVYDVFAEKVEAPEYGEKETVEVHINREGNVYSPAEDDIVSLDEVIFNMHK